MAETYVSGVDGSVTMPSASHNMAVKSWSASFTKHSSRVTRFGDASIRIRQGIQNCTGSLAGTPTFDAATLAPGAGGGSADRDGSALTLLVALGCSYAPTVAFENIAHTVDVEGDSSTVMDFANSNGVAIAETWDES